MGFFITVVFVCDGTYEKSLFTLFRISDVFPEKRVYINIRFLPNGAILNGAILLIIS